MLKSDLNLVTFIIRNDEPCASYAGPPSYRSAHIKLTPEQVSFLNLKMQEDVTQIYLEQDHRERKQEE